MFLFKITKRTKQRRKIKRIKNKKKELSLFKRFEEEKREELKTLPGISSGFTRYRDPTFCLHCIVKGDLGFLRNSKQVDNTIFV